MPTPERLIIENLFMIANKKGQDVPFQLNSTQAKLDETLTGRDIVTKARQEGVSAYVLALFTVRCLHKRNTKAVVISHDNESTERLFKRVRYYLDNLRGPKAVLETSNKREFSFPKTNSVFYIGTAGARKFGRGDTISDLHCSEVAFWDNPKELTAGLFQAVPESGTIILESTGNGRNWFYKRVQKARSGKGRYFVHFFDWLNFPEYQRSFRSEEEKQEFLDSLDDELEEIKLYQAGLTLEQLSFRREKLEELDYDLELFKQEYPMTIEECFRSSGQSIFHKTLYFFTQDWRKISPDLHILSGHPKKNYIYTIGADVGGGVEQDNSVIQIADLGNCEQVAEWVSNKIPPDVFAKVLSSIGRQFNNAFITVEANNHGIVTLNELRKIYPSYLIYKRTVTNQSNADTHILNLGLLETSRTRPLAIGLLRKMLATEFIIHSPALQEELDTFIEDPETHKLAAQAGCYDDRVMAMVALAYSFTQAAMKLGYRIPVQTPEEDPFTLDAIINELTNRRLGNFPIAPQVGGIDDAHYLLN